MASLKILTFPDRTLKIPTEAVTDFTGIDDTIKNIIETIVENNLFGLAANQVGINKSLFVVRVETDKTEKDTSNFMAFINPVIKGIKEKGRKFDWEACASIPQTQCLVERWSTIDVTAKNSKGEEFGMILSGHMARAVQHENSHLQGKLITDIARQIRHG